ncbi:MAG TPA: DUF885 family protein, partial [Blastocatellia bacterium]
MIRKLGIFILIALVAPIAPGQVTPMNEESKKLHALFKEDWEWGLEQFPEAATFLGDNRYNDRLTDLSPEAIDRRKAHEREMLARIDRIDRSRLSGQDLISYDLYLADKKFNVEGQQFPAEYMPISQMDGLQISFGQLAANTPF